MVGRQGRTVSRQGRTVGRLGRTVGRLGRTVGRQGRTVDRQGQTVSRWEKMEGRSAKRSCQSCGFVRIGRGASAWREMLNLTFLHLRATRAAPRLFGGTFRAVSCNGERRQMPLYKAEVRQSGPRRERAAQGSLREAGRGQFRASRNVKVVIDREFTLVKKQKSRTFAPANHTKGETASDLSHATGCSEAAKPKQFSRAEDVGAPAGFGGAAEAL